MNSRWSQIGWKTGAVSAVVVLTNALGNFALKLGMDQPAGLLDRILSPWLWLGIALLIVWTLSRMTLLSWADLSYVLPVTSLGYVLTALLGWFLLAERISSPRWAGVLLIVAGTALVGATRPGTTKGEGSP